MGNWIVGREKGKEKLIIYEPLIIDSFPYIKAEFVRDGYWKVEINKEIIYTNNVYKTLASILKISSRKLKKKLQSL